MGTLFQISGDGSAPLLPTRFSDQHLEEDLQNWVDACPSLVNEGAPLISLGIEVPTTHGHFIDNLLIDATGCLVVAELKRGRAPRDVASQLLDYAIYVDGLQRERVDDLCQKRHARSLDEQARATFGISGFQGEVPAGHRLIILAEDFDDRTIEHCQYLRSNGTPVACLQFSYFEAGGGTLLSVETVVGEIPDQTPALSDITPDPDVEALHLLFVSLEPHLQTLAGEGAELRIRRSKRALTFAPLNWPDLYWRRSFYIQQRSADGPLETGFWFNRPTFPDLQAWLEKELPAGLWESWVIREQPQTVMITTAQLPVPAVSDDGASAPVQEAIATAVGYLMPLLDAYFSKIESDGKTGADI